MLNYLMEYSNWTTNSTSPYNEYEYTSKEKLYYGVHKVKVQFENNSPIEASAKFDTGARTTSISFILGKQLGLSEELFKVAEELENHKIDKSISKDELEKQVEYLSNKYNLHLEKSRSASGVTIRVYFPITISYNGRIIKTQANLKDRTGLSCEMLIGLSDLL